MVVLGAVLVFLSIIGDGRSFLFFPLNEGIEEVTSSYIVSWCSGPPKQQKDPVRDSPEHIQQLRGELGEKTSGQKLSDST